MSERVYLDKNLINTDEFYRHFKNYYQYLFNKAFEDQSNDEEPRKFVKTLIYYFLEKNKFLKSPLLNTLSVPSSNKGLLIIGKFGTGKSSVMETLHKMFFDSNSSYAKFEFKNGNTLRDYKFGFGYHTANQIVKDFEACSNPDERKFFWDKMSKGVRYFDDLTTEKEASNFGKFNLFEDLLEMRYSNRVKTFISMNYNGDGVESTLEFLAIRYGERVYDRLFEMFNIIELKGKSFRR